MTTTESSRETALSYPLDHIRARYQHLHHVNAAQALRHERELKRYLVLCSEHPETSLPITPMLDEFWHEFLLHTRDYMEFCGKLGSGFIHHVPNTPSDSRAAATRHYVALLTLYEEVFRESPPADVWPRITASDAQLDDCSANSPPCDGAWAKL